jgi:hypothetical protein
MTALHEVIGHGSGKLSERLKGGAEPYLKEYFSTLEEGPRRSYGTLERVGPRAEEARAWSAIRRASRARCTTSGARVS